MYRIKKGYKQLNSCQAQYNSDSLISYDTEIARFTYDGGVMRLHIWRYPSTTSTKHLWKWFREIGLKDYTFGELLLDEWKYILKAKARYIIAERCCVCYYGDYSTAKRECFAL